MLLIYIGAHIPIKLQAHNLVINESITTNVCALVVLEKPCGPLIMVKSNFCSPIFDLKTSHNMCRLRCSQKTYTLYLEKVHKVHKKCIGKLDLL